MRLDFGGSYKPTQTIMLLRTPWPYSMCDEVARVLCKLTRCRWCNSAWGNRLETMHDRHADVFHVPADDATMTAFHGWMGWHYHGDEDEEGAA